MQKTCRICLRSNNTVINDVADYSQIIKKIAQIDVILDDTTYPSKVCYECVNDLLNADLLRDMLRECNSNTKEKIHTENAFDKTTLKPEISTETFDTKQEPESDSEMKEEYLIEEDFAGDGSENIPLEAQIVQEREQKPEKLVCNHCSAEFSSRVLLSKHLQSIHSERKKPKVKGKGKESSEYWELNKKSSRMTRHSTTYTCHHCNKPIHNLSAHMKTVHADLPPEFKCQFCGNMYEKISTLYTHTYSHHTNKASAVCDECGDVFNRKCRLEEHKRAVHQQLKLFVCEICTARFARKNNLTAHLRTHSGEKPYKCKFCTKAYNHFSDWKTHHLSHTGTWSYYCPTCNKGFYKPSTLKNHMKTH